MSMLLSAVHMPSAYEYTQASSDSNLRMGSMIRILEDHQTNCVILIDDGRALSSAIYANIRDWPVKYRKRVKALLTELKKRNRFVKVDSVGPYVSCCGSVACQAAFGLAASQAPDLTLSGVACEHCSLVNPQRIPLVGIGDYAVSEFAERRVRAERLELSNGEWKAEAFQREVWEPIFQHAKHVKLVDRMIGRHMVEAVRRGHPPQVRSTYATSIDWIAKVFANFSVNRFDRSIHIFTSVDSGRLSADQIAACSHELRRFATEISDSHDCPVEMIVKDEGKGMRMRHARFLLTDQVSLMIERGFDLLNYDGTIRDVVITHIDKPGKIEREFKALPDAL